MTVPQNGLCVALPVGTPLVSIPVAVAVKLFVDVTQAQTPVFQTSFIAAVANVTGVSVNRVTITSIVAGSTIITTMIAPDPSGTTSTAPTAVAAAAALRAQVAVNSTSSTVTLSFNNVLVNTLSNNGINVPMRVIDPNYTPPLTTGTKCTDGSYQVTCPAPTPSGSTDALSPGAIAGIVIGSIVFIALVAVGIYYASLPSKPEPPKPTATENAIEMPVKEDQIKVEI